MSKIEDVAYEILNSCPETRSSIKDFHIRAFCKIYGSRTLTESEFFDLIFSKKYNFFTWDRARIKIQKLIPRLAPDWDRDEQKEKYINFAKTPLEILEFGGLYEKTA